MAAVVSSVFIHSSLNKKTQAKAHTAARHYGYTNRLSAVEYSESINLPISFKAAQRAIRAHERQVRANGRIGDKFFGIFPQETKFDHAIEITRNFVAAVGLGRARSNFTLHNFRTSGDNPHTHVLFLDYDIRTRAKVFGTSTRGSTERLKDIWEREANAIFAREGYEVRIDRREWNRIKTLEAEEAMIALARMEMSPDAPTHDLEPANDDVQQSGEQEPDMPKSPEEVRQRARKAIIYQHELAEVRRRIQEEETLHTEMIKVQHSVERAKEELASHETHAANARLKAESAAWNLNAHVRADGSLRGFRVPIVGWKTPGRVAAEAAKAEADNAVEAQRQTEVKLSNHLAYLEREQQDAARLEAEYRQIAGSPEDMKIVEQDFSNEVEKQLNGWEEQTQEGHVVKHAALDAAEIWALVETMDITEEEARELFKEMGAVEYLQMLDRGQEIE